MHTKTEFIMKFNFQVPAQDFFLQTYSRVDL